MRALSLSHLLIRRQAACPNVGAQQIPHLSNELPCCRCCGLLTTGQGVEERLYERLQVGLESLYTQTPSDVTFMPCSGEQVGHTSINSTGQWSNSCQHFLKLSLTPSPSATGLYKGHDEFVREVVFVLNFDIKIFFSLM